VCASAETWPPSGSNYNNFPATENPLSQGAWWDCGHTVGLDWKDVQTIAGGKAEATGINLTTDDSICALRGQWGPSQQGQLTIGAIPGYHNENEILLNFSIVAHVAKGYENNCANGYQQIVKWHGSQGNFTIC
jgi:hypothetical protein